MNKLPTICPICAGEIAITRIYCRECDTTIEGRFSSRSFAQLSPEQLDFVETFVRCEGKLNRMTEEVGVSYPTLRNRLHEVIRALGYEPGGADEPSSLSGEARQNILEDLDAGRISVQAAMSLLNKGG
jgi:hypothetical protein